MSTKPNLDELFFSKTMDFLNLYLPRQSGKSLQTVRTYRLSLSAFYDYVTGEKGLSPLNFRFTDCTYEFMLGYSQYLQEKKGLKPRSVNTRMAAVKSYLKYSADSSIELTQVYLTVQKVPRLREEKKQRPILEKDPLKRLFELPSDTPRGNRDRVLLIFLFECAVRASELSAVTLGDLSLDVSSPIVIIHGKGKKQRVIALNDATAAHLRMYISQYHLAGATPDTPLFYTVIHGEYHHMSVRNIERIVKKYADQLREEYPDIPESVYPHLLRRTRATGLHRDGVDLSMVSTLLGHSSMETTKIYATPSLEQMREVMEKGYPAREEEPKLWEGKEDEMKKTFGL